MRENFQGLLYIGSGKLSSYLWQEVSGIRVYTLSKAYSGTLSRRNFRRLKAI